MSPPPARVPDCQACGACCRHGGEVLVGHDEDVPKHLTRSIRNVVGFASWEAETHVRMARDADDRCVALSGILGMGCACRIYERRPVVCREFEAGCDGCHEARRKAGLEPVTDKLGDDPVFGAVSR